MVLRKNVLLSAISTEALAAMQLQHVELPFKQTLSEPGEPITAVYFPISGVVSMVNEPNPGEIVEFATIGREGFAGLPLLLGSDTMPSRVLVQVPGEAFRASKEDFLAAVAAQDELRAVLLRYSLALLSQVAQSTSCNRLHEVQERCARWLLQTHDRSDGDSFPLTQEFLAQMLGVHRPTVTVAAGMLQKAQLIDYARGVITVRDRAGLEAASCPCYRLIADEYDRLVGLTWASRQGGRRLAAD
jgi:CRP-like cAMP-binding protein